MRITTAAALALTVLLATTTLGAVAATASTSAPPAAERSPSLSVSLSPALQQSHSASSSSVAGQSLERPETWQVTRIHVTDDGTAKWTIESRFLVTNDTEATSFEEYADAVVSEQRDPYRELFGEYASYAAESTGREMTIRDAGWDDPRIERLESDGQSADGTDVRVGILSYTFTWTNFATVDDGRIYVGDALQTSDGPLFRTLNDGQRLVIEPPDDNYGFVDAPTGTEDGALVWDGPREFGADGLEITIIRGAGGSSLLSGSTALFLGFAVLAVVVGTGGYLFARREDVDVPVPVSLDALPVPGRDQGGAAGPTEPPTEGDGGSESVGGPAVDTPSSHGPGPQSGTELEFEESDDDGIDPELLSDEERVLRLLNENGGRMKQASIVSETGWSNAKVSQLLSKMDEEGEIEKLRIGRENLITLPGVDPTALD